MGRSGNCQKVVQSVSTRLSIFLNDLPPPLSRRTSVLYQERVGNILQFSIYQKTEIKALTFYPHWVPNLTTRTYILRIRCKTLTSGLQEFGVVGPTPSREQSSSEGVWDGKTKVLGGPWGAHETFPRPRREVPGGPVTRSVPTWVTTGGDSGCL